MKEGGRKGGGGEREREKVTKTHTMIPNIFTILTHCKSPKGGNYVTVYSFSGNADQVVLILCMYSASQKGKRNMYIYLSLYGILTR